MDVKPPVLWPRTRGQRFAGGILHWCGTFSTLLACAAYGLGLIWVLSGEQGRLLALAFVAGGILSAVAGTFLHAGGSYLGGWIKWPAENRAIPWLCRAGLRDVLIAVGSVTTAVGLLAFFFASPLHWGLALGVAATGIALLWCAFRVAAAVRRWEREEP